MSKQVKGRNPGSLSNCKYPRTERVDEFFLIFWSSLLFAGKEKRIHRERHRWENRNCQAQKCNDVLWNRYSIHYIVEFGEGKEISRPKGGIEPLCR